MPLHSKFDLTDLSNLDLQSVVQLAQMSTPNREDSVYLAKLAEQAERYEGEFYS